MHACVLIRITATDEVDWTVIYPHVVFVRTHTDLALKGPCSVTLLCPLFTPWRRLIDSFTNTRRETDEKVHDSDWTGRARSRRVVPHFGVILLQQQFNLQQRTGLMTLGQDTFNRMQVRLGTLTWPDKGREISLSLWCHRAG